MVMILFVEKSCKTVKSTLTKLAVKGCENMCKELVLQKSLACDCATVVSAFINGLDKGSEPAFDLCSSQHNI